MGWLGSAHYCIEGITSGGRYESIVPIVPIVQRESSIRTAVLDLSADFLLP